jgi:hypothetical protein
MKDAGTFLRASLGRVIYTLGYAWMGISVSLYSIKNRVYVVTCTAPSPQTPRSGPKVLRAFVWPLRGKHTGSLLGAQMHRWPEQNIFGKNSNTGAAKEIFVRIIISRVCVHDSDVAWTIHLYVSNVHAKAHTKVSLAAVTGR